MARPDFREILAWALFATVTVVYLHSRTQFELCMTQLESSRAQMQLESSRAQMRASTAFPLVEPTGPTGRSNASLSDEPSGAVGYADPLADVELADGTTGRTF